MDYDKFMNLETADMAQLVQNSGLKTCAFPTEGTTRWFMLEHPAEFQKNQADAYFDRMVPAHLQIFRLLFEHGIEIVLEPMVGTGLLDREPAYVGTIPEGFARLIRHPDFKNLCDEHQVQVRFYGDYQRVLANTPYAAQAATFDAYSQQLAAQTGHYQKHRLLLGIYPDEALETVAHFAVQHYQKHGQIPSKKEIVAAYYGEYLPQIDMFIGSGKPALFGLPLLPTDGMALYFTVSPSLYFTEKQLRHILYDYLYARQGAWQGYAQMPPQEWAFMREFYRTNRESVMGVGQKSQTGGIWYPLPQVVWPSSDSSLKQDKNGTN